MTKPYLRLRDVNRNIVRRWELPAEHAEAARELGIYSELWAPSGRAIEDLRGDISHALRMAATFVEDYPNIDALTALLWELADASQIFIGATLEVPE